MTELTTLAETLRSLHRGSQPLVLPNAWDVISARAITDAGFPVVATSSLAIATSLGLPDTDAMGADVAFSVIERIARAVDLPVTADLEAGYGCSSRELVARLVGAGAVGANIEDTDYYGDGQLVDADRQAERIRDLREATASEGVPIVLNARIDVYLRQVGDPASRYEETARRARAYLEAGADCVYPIGLSDEKAIGGLVSATRAPVNIWLRPGGVPLKRLAELGVARISLAAGLQRFATASMRRALLSLQSGDESGMWPSE